VVLGGRGVQVYSNEVEHLSSRGDNSKILKIFCVKKNLKKQPTNFNQISYIHPWVKGINKESEPLKKGDDKKKNSKMLERVENFELTIISQGKAVGFETTPKRN
jgi:hypothetical protein